MNKEKFYSLANDITFKYLFKNSKTRSFFEEIIKYYTDIDVGEFEFIDNELDNGNGVSDRLDSILVNKDKSIILNVELNREYKDYITISPSTSSDIAFASALFDTLSFKSSLVPRGSSIFKTTVYVPSLFWK